MKYLILILVFAFAVRMYHLTTPPTYYFDEVYHAVTAKLYARNDPAGYEWWHPAPEPDTAIEWLHPPLAKLTQAVGIVLFGENAMGWRISSVVFGLGVIVLTYVLALQIFKVERIALLSALLVSIDGLLFTQSRIAMNDIHVVFFILLSLITYLNWKEQKISQKKLLLLSGIAAGLAISTKWSGIFVLGIYGVDQLLTWIKAWKLPNFRVMFHYTFAWIIIPFIVYIISYTQFWLQGHTIDQFIELHKQTWYYQTHLTATHTYQSTPLQWVFDLRPVWFHVQYESGKIANIYDLGNPLLLYGGFVALLYLFAQSIHKFEWRKWFLVLSYFGVWFVWMWSPRIMFFYHYAPAIPLLSIAFGWCIHDLTKKKTILLTTFGYLLISLSIVWFIVFYPNMVGLFVPIEFAEKVYFAIPGWR
ncbi:MAG: phospholipid carrier-dependent glycosyltransferase [Candidatus Pacebacteria bacterium]|nr:phospholipid carrier-dependent glycosyltransferase [Candidatus Paceibacterota bacterium]